MALNLKNDEVERLAAEVARLTGESKTEAIRRALEERRRRLRAPAAAESEPGYLDLVDCMLEGDVVVGDDFRHTDIKAAR